MGKNSSSTITLNKYMENAFKVLARLFKNYYGMIYSNSLTQSL